MRPLAQSAFIDEDHRAALVLAFFLTPASAPVSTVRSCLRPAPALVRWGVVNSSQLPQNAPGMPRVIADGTFFLDQVSYPCRCP